MGSDYVRVHPVKLRLKPTGLKTKSRSTAKLCVKFQLPNSQCMCLARLRRSHVGPAAPRSAPHRAQNARRGPRSTRGKMPDDARGGSGVPSAGAQSVGQRGRPRAGGETTPPRVGAPAAHFSGLTLRGGRFAPRVRRDSAAVTLNTNLPIPNFQLRHFGSWRLGNGN
jgi:hypothetical protein